MSQKKRKNSGRLKSFKIGRMVTFMSPKITPHKRNVFQASSPTRLQFLHQSSTPAPIVPLASGPNKKATKKRIEALRSIENRIFIKKFKN